MTWTLAGRAARLNPSILREILKLSERPGILSLAGGLPSPDSFPVQTLREATERVLRDTPREALQYAASEGHGPLREWVAAEVTALGMQVRASQVLITSGSQQGLDLVGKLLIDPGSQVRVEAPTYLGALQAFAPYEPDFVPLESDDDGPLPESLGTEQDQPARFAYLLPNFQNPSGRCISAARRDALMAQARRLRLPIVEDNPYGELWYDTPPPPPLAAHAPEQAIYLGSFSKVLAPGLRLGYLVAPEALYPKLLQAKQAADLHTPGFNQRIVHEVVRDGFLARHVPAIRERYRLQRDAMHAALERHWRGPGFEGCRWQVPGGGMFFWVELAPGVDTMALLPKAVAAGVAFVPGAAFYCQAPRANTLRLSFVTVPPERIEGGVAALADVVRESFAAGGPAPFTRPRRPASPALRSGAAPGAPTTSPARQ